MQQSNLVLVFFVSIVGGIIGSNIFSEPFEKFVRAKAKRPTYLSSRTDSVRGPRLPDLYITEIHGNPALSEEQKQEATIKYWLDRGYRVYD